MALGWAWTMIGSRENSKLEKCPKSRTVPTCPEQFPRTRRGQIDGLVRALASCTNPESSYGVIQTLPLNGGTYISEFKKNGLYIGNGTNKGTYKLINHNQSINIQYTSGPSASTDIVVNIVPDPLVLAAA